LLLITQTNKVMPERSQTAVFNQSMQPFEMAELPIPPLQKGEILVRNECTSICRSDLHTYSGKRQEKTPTILGHEIVGRIVSLGENAPATDVRGHLLGINDRITWAIFSSDPTSELAQKGIPQKGAQLLKYGHEHLTDTHTLHGGLSQYTILRNNTPLIKIDEKVPLKVASIVNCSVATVAGALRLAGDVAGQTVLVSGVGMLGIVACAMCKSAGAANVIALDIDDHRLEISRKFGADVALNVRENWQAYIQKTVGTCDKILEMSGVADAMEQTLSVLGIGGTAVWVGAVAPQRPLQIDAQQIVRKLHTVKGLHNYNVEDFIAAVAFVEQYHQIYPFESVIHDSFCLAEINEAFAYALQENPLRVSINIE
jgi:putative phosphonate catabolism associated alcohol dehydrogenase